MNAKKMACSLSDWQCLDLFQSPIPQRRADVDEQIAYKALAALANSGIRKDDEMMLPEDMRTLLEARRLLRKNDLDGAYGRIATLESRQLQPLLEGDKLMVQAFIRQRRDDMRGAVGLHRESARILGQTTDEHRALRSLINAELCRGDHDAIIAGDLVSLERRVNELGYADLSGNIRKGRAAMLLFLGRFDQALVEALGALECYKKDGYPTDIAITRCMTAILYHVTGDHEAARRMAGEVHIRDGRVAPYWSAYEALVAGRAPVVPKGHPLDGAQWPVHRVRSQSVKGRILKRLNQGPVSRDELIREIWGEGSDDPSYCNRLYATLNQMRKQGGVRILFDGGRYRLG